MKKIGGNASAASRAIWGDTESEDDSSSDTESLLGTRSSSPSGTIRQEENYHEIHRRLVPVNLAESEVKNSLGNDHSISYEPSKSSAEEPPKKIVDDNKQLQSNPSLPPTSNEFSESPRAQVSELSYTTNEVDVSDALTNLEESDNERIEREKIVGETNTEFSDNALQRECVKVYTTNIEDHPNSGNELSKVVKAEPDACDNSETVNNQIRNLHEDSTKNSYPNQEIDTAKTLCLSKDVGFTENENIYMKEIFDESTNNILDVSKTIIEGEPNIGEKNDTFLSSSLRVDDGHANDLSSFIETQSTDHGTANFPNHQTDLFELGKYDGSSLLKCEENLSRNVLDETLKTEASSLVDQPGISQEEINDHTTSLRYDALKEQEQDQDQDLSSIVSTEAVSLDYENRQTEVSHRGEIVNCTSNISIFEVNIDENGKDNFGKTSNYSNENKNNEIKFSDSEEIEEISTVSLCQADFPVNEMRKDAYTQPPTQNSDKNKFGEPSEKGDMGLDLIEPKENSKSTVSNILRNSNFISAEIDDNEKNKCEVETLHEESQNKMSSAVYSKTKNEIMETAVSDIPLLPDIIDGDESIKLLGTQVKGDAIPAKIEGEQSNLHPHKDILVSTEKKLEQLINETQIFDSNINLFPKTTPATLGDKIITLPIRSKVLYKKPSVMTLHSSSSTAISATPSTHDEISAISEQTTLKEDSTDLLNGDLVEKNISVPGSSEIQTERTSDKLDGSKEDFMGLIHNNSSAAELESSRGQGMERFPLAPRNEDSRPSTSSGEKQKSRFNILRLKSSKEFKVEKRGSSQRVDGLTDQRAFYRHSSIVSQKFPDIIPKNRKSSSRSESSAPEKVKMSLKEKIKLKIGDKLHRHKD